MNQQIDIDPFRPENSDADEGCGTFIDDDAQTITLTLEDDTEVKCLILTVFPSNEHQYIALIPMEEEEIRADSEVYLYRFLIDSEGEPILENIEDDEEYQNACNAFLELADQQEDVDD